MARLVSKIYGDALFEFAKEQNQSEMMFEQALDIIDVLSVNGDVKDFLTNPKLSIDEKIKFVRDLFADKIWNGPIGKTNKFFNLNGTKGDDLKIIDFIAIVINKGRQNELLPILRHFTHLVLSDKNIGEAEVVSASELNDEKKDALTKKLIASTKYDDFIVDYKVDKSLIAGLKIKIDDKVFDKTYKTKIFDIQKSLRGLKL